MPSSRPRIAPLLAALLLLLLSTACQTGIRGYHEQDPEADFSRFKSFVWVAQGPLLQTEAGSQEVQISPIMERYLHAAVERELIAKGYERREKPGPDSLAVSYSVSARQEVQVDTYPVHGGYAYPRAGAWQSTTSVRTYTRGTLAITLFDAASKLAIWHGWASKRIYESTDQATRQATIDEAVAAILADLPARGAGS